MGGFIGLMAVVKLAAFNLISTWQMQSKEMGSDSRCELLSCLLYSKNGPFLELSQHQIIGLYFIDIYIIIMYTINLSLSHSHADRKLF